MEDQLEDINVDMPSKIILKLLMNEIWRYELDWTGLGETQWDTSVNTLMSIHVPW